MDCNCPDCDCDCHCDSLCCQTPYGPYGEKLNIAIAVGNIAILLLLVALYCSLIGGDGMNIYNNFYKANSIYILVYKDLCYKREASFPRKGH